MTGAYGITLVPAGTEGAFTCGDSSCGRAWLPDIIPSGRCPWEHLHDDPAPERSVHHIEAKVVFADGTEVQVLIAEGTDMAWGASTEYLADTLDLRAVVRDAFQDQWER
uniref:Uncharacterized protein n=2 Tax=unclassified bacterial viruses TaxID=12333 RepID=A0AAU7J8C0_9VIRU